MTIPIFRTALLALAVVGFAGCQTSTDPCADIDCSFHGTCAVLDDGPICRCDPGFVTSGLVCHRDWCAQLFCRHGTCTQNAQKGSCQCMAGWSGTLCDSCDEGYHIDNNQCLPDQPCDSDPCIHGTCLVIDGLETCDCDAGYSGDQCDQCDQGYHPDGLVCVADEINPCNPNPCDQSHRGQCSVSGDSYVCSCDPGFHDETGTCVPDQQDACSPNPCTEKHRTQCSVSGDSFMCNCDTGYNDDSGACLPDCSSDQDTCNSAHPSYFKMVSANGHGVVGYDLNGAKVTSFLEHVYRNWDEGVTTRNLLYDSYLGIRTQDLSIWLDQVDVRRAEYLSETGIIHIVQHVSTFVIDTYVYAPWNLDRTAMVLTGKVTNKGTEPADVSIYTIHNYHLGSTSESDPANPGFDGERIVYNSTNGILLESGPGGLMVHWPLDAPSHHGFTPNNPWHALHEGLDLSDDIDSSTGDDRVAGFQKDFTLDPGQAGWFGVVSAFDPFKHESDLIDDVRQAYAGLTSQTALGNELDSWDAWRTSPPDGLSPDELFVWRQSEAILRQGQVWESTDLSFGQIVASLPPGAWNICWVRDMAYAVLALVKTGHMTEARAALDFVLSADSGNFVDYTGVPYKVSITRYYGRGKEETDLNTDGPNIEFDGFGLFLWALGEYTKESGDTSLVNQNWPIIRDDIANALLSLLDSDTGMISADSSIWEVHWNGKQKRYSFTSLAASKGLEQASVMATIQGDESLADTYSLAALSIRDALEANCTDGEQVLASSYEELTNNSGYFDMAVAEALNWMLFDPFGDTATATLEMFGTNLKVPSGRGFFRNDDGGWYDNQEWVFTDLRASCAFRLAGRSTIADKLLGWVTSQALFNHGMIAELYHPDTGDYEGETPMVGFGAGAYILALMDRSSPPELKPAVGSWETR